MPGQAIFFSQLIDLNRFNGDSPPAKSPKIANACHHGNLFEIIRTPTKQR
jgi:hypothetical protein